MNTTDEIRTQPSTDLASNLIESPRPHDKHFCRIYQKESALVDSVVRYLAAGVSSGETLVLITRSGRQKKILDWLEAKGADLAQLRKNGRIFTYTSSDLMEAISVEGVPDWNLFNELALGLIDEASAKGSRRLRLYGDAVSEFWQTGDHRSSVLLEQFWNRFRAEQSHRFSAFCGYLIDALDIRSYSDELTELALQHEVTLPSSDDTILRCALDAACQKVVGGSINDMATDRPIHASENGLPFVFRFVLWFRETHPESLEDLLGEARAAYRRLV